MIRVCVRVVTVFFVEWLKMSCIGGSNEPKWGEQTTFVLALHTKELCANPIPSFSLLITPFQLECRLMNIMKCHIINVYKLQPYTSISCNALICSFRRCCCCYRFRFLFVFFTVSFCTIRIVCGTFFCSSFQQYNYILSKRELAFVSPQWHRINSHFRLACVHLFVCIHSTQRDTQRRQTRKHSDCAEWNARNHRLTSSKTRTNTQIHKSWHWLPLLR